MSRFQLKWVAVQRDWLHYAEFARALRLNFPNLWAPITYRSWKISFDHDLGLWHYEYMNDHDGFTKSGQAETYLEAIRDIDDFWEDSQ